MQSFAGGSCVASALQLRSYTEESVVSASGMTSAVCCCDVVLFMVLPAKTGSIRYYAYAL
jgi:hypothetical protein